MGSLAEWNTFPAHEGGPASVLDRIIAILDAVKESAGALSVTDVAVRSTSRSAFGCSSSARARAFPAGSSALRRR